MRAVQQIRRWAAAICLVSLVGAGPLNTRHDAQAQNLRDAEKGALKDFLKRAKDYLNLEHGLPAAQLKPTSDAQELENRRIALRAAIQQARPNAKQGDIFSTQSEPVFRMLLAHAMGEHGDKVRASLQHAEPVAPKQLTINGVYPNAQGVPLQSTPPSLLAKLPVLPKGLEYRVSGRTLVLRDTEANIVVDFLPDALP